MTPPRILTALAVLGITAAPLSAMADDGITLSVTVPVYGQYDNTYTATDNSEGSDLYATIEPEIIVGLPRGFSLQAGLVFEPVSDRDPGRDRAFKSHGAYVQTLQLVWEAEPFMVHAGKFTPTFGFDETHGMYGDTFLSDYELTERLGFGGAVTVPIDGIADVTLAASLFTRDRSFLSESTITSRDHLRTSDGTPGNTKGLKNGAVAIDLRPAPHPELLIRASYLRQGKGQGDASGQTAYGLGATYEYALSEDVAIAPMIDWVRAHDTIGFTDGTSTPGARTDTITAGGRLSYGQWFGTLTHGARIIKDPAAPTIRDRFTQVSAGYEFDIGLALETGWMRLHDTGEKSSTVGVVASYAWEF
ncbi:MAG: hypothetical protein WCZ23_06435 [Rhodospirillaceae bacterium]